MMKTYEELLLPERARQSCIDLQQDHVRGSLALPAWLDTDAAKVFAASLDLPTVRAIGNSLATSNNQTRMAGHFDSIQQEAGLILLMHALDFGGGWRQELHAHHGKGAFLTVKPGVEALFEQNPHLQATYLSSLQETDVGLLFGLSNSEPLKPLVVLLTMVCNEVGRGVAAAGHDTVGDYLMAAVQRANETATPAQVLVQTLVESFPRTFDDHNTISMIVAGAIMGRPQHLECQHQPTQQHRDVYFYKKAQLVVGELCHRFQDEDARFQYPDLNHLTAFIDNVICAVLRKHGVVATTAELAHQIETHGNVPSGSLEEVSLRAAAMAGVEWVCSSVSMTPTTAESLAPCTLGNYLWGHLGKRPDHRVYERHSTKDTVFY